MIWQDSDKSKQDVLCQIALGEEVTSQHRYLIRELQRSGYLTENPPEPFSQTFAEFLVAKRPGAMPRKPANQRAKQSTDRSSLSDRIKGFFRRNGS